MGGFPYEAYEGINPNYDKLSREANDLRCQLEEAKAAEKCAYENVDSTIDLLRRDCEKLNKEVAELRAEIERLRKAAIEWVQAPCTSPTCRGLKNGSPFMVTCEKGRENQAVCNECFCK